MAVKPVLITEEGIRIFATPDGSAYSAATNLVGGFVHGFFSTIEEALAAAEDQLANGRRPLID